MVKDSVKVNFKEVFKDWEPLLRERILQSNYMSRLMEFLEEEYKNKRVWPLRKDVFRAFRLTSYDETRVVIIGQDPYPSKIASGLAFGNEFDVCGDKLSPSLQKIQKCLEDNVYGGLNLNFDPTMVSWAKQGVLLLNSSLTVLEGQPGSHTKYWNRFIKTVITELSKNKTGVCYLLLGAQARHLEDYINKGTNYVFSYMHPAFASRAGIDWNCPHFKNINDIIINQNGKDYCIKW